jgi:adenylate cyclase
MDRASVYIPMDRRLALGHGEELPEQVRGAALLADISGFTLLTDALVQALGPRRAGEELTRCLNQVYEALIDAVHRRRGSVVSFAGDAITCWFDGDDGLRATACALAMQEAAAEFGAMPIPGGETVEIAVKVAVTVGPARRFAAGNPDVSRLDLLAGTTIARLAIGEHLATRGEVLLHGDAARELGAALDIVAWRDDEETGEQFAVVRRVSSATSAEGWPPSVELPDEIARQWLLAPVHERLGGGQDEFQGEIRPSVALFMSFGGLEYDVEKDAPARLDAYLRWVQGVIARYGGHLLQVIIGDKGSYLYASFGALIAHDDDARRAVAAALELQALPDDLRYVDDVRIGVAGGRMYSGAYGASSHRTHGIHGDSVTLAARLMQAAEPGGVLVNRGARRAVSRGFLWEELPPIRVKNKPAPVPVFRAVPVDDSGSREIDPSEHDLLPLVGRQPELERIERMIKGTVSGRGEILLLLAEAGMGKSRLVAEAVHRWRGRTLEAYVGECESFAAQAPYYVWRAILRAFFHLGSEDDQEERVRLLEQQLAAIDPALAHRLPLLGVALNLPIPDNDLTRSLEGQLRKSSLEALVVDVFRARARQAPLMVVLEDCHWLDPLSRDLLQAIGRGVAGLPVLLAIALRPPTLGEEGALPPGQLARAVVLELDSLAPEEAERLIRLKLSLMLGDETQPPPGVMRRLADIAHGNPFYVEELLNYIRDRGVDLQDEEAFERLEMPASLDSLILSRIDQLSAEQKTTVKVASVIGRQFRESWLWGAHPGIGPRARIEADLRALHTLDLTLLDQPRPEPVYLFKHIITRDVAYGSIPFGLREQLHGSLGGFVERTYADVVDQYLDLLAYHYELSAIVPKQREYFGRAGDAAQRAYANEAAERYFRRLLPLLAEAEQPPVLFKLGQVLDFVGRWDEAAELYRLAVAGAEASSDRSSEAASRHAIGWLLRKMGDYDQASTWLHGALDAFEGLGDRQSVVRMLVYLGELSRAQGDLTAAYSWGTRALQQADTIEEDDQRRRVQALALTALGTLTGQQGNIAEARMYSERALAMQRALGNLPGEASLLINLGVLAYYGGDSAQAIELDEQALPILRDIGDRFVLVTVLNNLGDLHRGRGDHTTALTYLNESLDLARQLGSQSNLAMCLNTLADTLLDEGKWGAARDALMESLTILRELGERAGLPYLLDDFSAVLSQEGRAEASLQLAGAAEALREEIGIQLSAGERERFDELRARARSSLDGEAAAAARSAGRSMSLEQAIEIALSHAQPLGAMEDIGGSARLAPPA